MHFNAREPQELMRQFALDHPRCNLFASPGTGKTGAAYDIFATLHMLGDVRRALVLGPKRVAKNVWPSERDKWHESFGHLKVAAAIGSPEHRTSVVRSNPDILAINYENIEWLVDGYGGKWPFDMVIADESTRLKGFRAGINTHGKIEGQGAVRAKKLAEIAKKTRRWINMTGSPAPNGLQDLYGQQWFIDMGRRLGHTFDDFQKRWFHSSASPDGYTILEAYKHSQPEIQALMKDCSISIDARDYYPITEALERHIMVDLPPKARAAYQTMEKDLFADVNKHAVEVFTSGGKSNKCLQIANGSVFYDDGVWTPAHDEKIEALASLKEELNGEPMLVRYLFKPDRERILKAFPRARFLDDRQATIDEWNAGKIPMLVTHAASAGHGLSLQHGGRVLVDYGSNFNLEEDEQILERVGPTRQFQSGYDRMVYRYRIIARDTIEELSVLPRLHKKISVQDAFKAAMKMR